MTASMINFIFILKNQQQSVLLLPSFLLFCLLIFVAFFACYLCSFYFSLLSFVANRSVAILLKISFTLQPVFAEQYINFQLFSDKKLWILIIGMIFVSSFISYLFPTKMMQGVLSQFQRICSLQYLTVSRVYGRVRSKTITIPSQFLQ